MAEYIEREAILDLLKNKYQDKPVLDACCGSRMFWFDKENPNVVFAISEKCRITSIIRDAI